jgi:hypothetical protein
VPLWIVLLLSAALMFMLFFADSAERALVQATMIGGVVVAISSTLLLLWFLGNQYHAGVGGLRPVAMDRVIRVLDQEAAVVGGKLTVPCDERRNPGGGGDDSGESHEQSPCHVRSTQVEALSAPPQAAGRKGARLYALRSAIRIGYGGSGRHRYRRP